jgi:biopolymer transport protein ExbB
MYPLLLLSIAAIVVIFERSVAFHQYGQVPVDLLSKVIDACRKGQFEDASNYCSEKSGPLAACLCVVLHHKANNTRDIERLVEETGQDYFIRLERFLAVLDTTTTISPLLGLLGTIVGMIGAFNAIAAQAHHGNNDAVLAGVGEALYATATGLIIAVVCFAAYNYFAARLRYITAETEQAATKLINVLVEQHHARRHDNPSENHAAPVAAEGKDHGIQASPRA